MFAWRSAFFMAAMLLSLTAPCLAYAGTPLSERVAVEAGGRAEGNKIWPFLTKPMKHLLTGTVWTDGQ